MTKGGEGIEDALRRLGRRLFDRDSRIVEEFAEDAVLIGSEAGERADGRVAIGTLITGLFGRPARLTWDWQRVDVVVDGEVGWVVAEGHVVVSTESEKTLLPYRMTGVLHFQNGHWRWRLFHGSEPAGGPSA